MFIFVIPILFWDRILTWHIMTRLLIADVLPIPGHWLLLSKIFKKNSCLLCHQRKTAQWSHHGTIPPWLCSYLWYATLSKSFKKFSWPYLQTSPFFGTTCWCWLQVPWRQHNLDAHTSTPPRFNCKKMLLLWHVSLISDKPTLCPANNKPIQLSFSACQLY